MTENQSFNFVNWKSPSRPGLWKFSRGSQSTVVKKKIQLCAFSQTRSTTDSGHPINKKTLIQSRQSQNIYSHRDLPDRITVKRRKSVKRTYLSEDWSQGDTDNTRPPLPDNNTDSSYPSHKSLFYGTLSVTYFTVRCVFKWMLEDKCCLLFYFYFFQGSFLGGGGLNAICDYISVEE